MGNKKTGSSEERLSVFLSLVLRHQPASAGISRKQPVSHWTNTAGQMWRL